MAVGFLNREGKQVPKSEWQELRGDESYKQVRRYDNGVVNVDLEWVGRIPDFGTVFPDFYKVFKLSVSNYTEDGKLVPDPVITDRFFHKEAAAISFYEEFLTRWTNSGVSDTGVFQEADNTLTPPPPEDPNRPESAISGEGFDEVGAW